MTANDSYTEPLEEPLAELETYFINEYLARVGQTLSALRGRADDNTRTLLSAASTYAAGRLTEIESRQHYLRQLRGGE